MSRHATNASDCGGLDFLLALWPAGTITGSRQSACPTAATNRFNSREVARALKAARLAGERPERVEIDPATGRITVIIAQAGDASTAAATTNEWDEVAK